MALGGIRRSDDMNSTKYKAGNEAGNEVLARETDVLNFTHYCNS